MMRAAVEQPYVSKPVACLDSISGAMHKLREWGDYGYSMSIEASDWAGGALYGCRHSDGSEFYIHSDRYGCARQVEWNGVKWESVEPVPTSDWEG
jgi:hypothetical protein